MRKIRVPDKFGLCIKIALFASLLLYPLFFRLDFSKSTYDFLDITSMISPYALVYLSVLCLLLSLLILLSKRISLIHVIVASLLVYGLYVASQYPTVMSGDIWGHGRSVKQVVIYGNTQVPENYPNWWPGAFVLWACLSTLSGLDIILTGTILTFMVMVLSSVLFWLLGTMILGQRWAGLAAMLHLITYVGGFHLLARDRFVPQSLGFIQYLVLLYLILRITRIKHSKRQIGVLSLLSISCIIVSHPFTSVCVLFTLIGIMAIEIVRRIRLGVTVKLLGFTCTFWFAWWIFNSGPTFSKAIDLVAYALGSLGQTKLGSYGVMLEEPLPILGVILRNFYFKPLLLIIGLISLFVAFRARKVKSISFFSGILLGTAAVSIVVLTTPVGTEVAQTSQILMFGLLPVCFIASRLFVKQGLRVKISSIIVIFLIVPSFLHMFTYGAEYVAATHLWEIESCQFIIDHVQKAIVGSDGGTHMVYRFLDIDYPAGIPGYGAIVLRYINYTSWLRDYPTFFEGDVVLRSFKQELVYSAFAETLEERRNFWLTVDLNLINTKNYNRIYDSKYTQSYVTVSNRTKTASLEELP